MVLCPTFQSCAARRCQCRTDCVGHCILYGMVENSFAALSLLSFVFLGINTGLNARVYTEKIRVTRGMFHGMPRESVAKLVCIVPCGMHFVCLFTIYCFIICFIDNSLPVSSFSVSFIISANMN